MRQIFTVLWAVLLMGSVLFAAPVRGEDDQERGGEKLFAFKQLVGVSGVFRGSTMPLRGVPGGGAPWVLAQGKATLDANGKLKVEVEGLVIAPSFGPPFGGTNPVPRFFATLSCLDPLTGAVNNHNTATVPASQEGDAKIKAVLTLPATCVDPLVLVRGDLSSIPGNPFNNPAGPDASDPWFAASGF